MNAILLVTDLPVECSTLNLQSLGPMTAISAGKIYGLSWGNQASSTIFDSSQSATPVIAFTGGGRSTSHP